MPRRRLTPDERELWGQLQKTVQPIFPSSSPEEKPTRTEKEIIFPVPTPLPTIPGRPPRPRQPLPELKVDDLTVMDRRLAQRLRRGELPIAATLDLHGMTVVQAQPALERFITEAASRGNRCVLVITGKGLRSNPAEGVLKREMPRWLALPALRDRILAVTPARPVHGGSGAFYVLLKRDRAGY